MNLLTRLTQGRRAEQRYTLEDYAGWLDSFAYNGLWYPAGLQQTLVGDPRNEATERSSDGFQYVAATAYATNGVVFACMLVRMLVFSSIRFQWQRLRNGKPSDTYGTRDLRLLERPWPNGTTQDLLTRMIQDADLAGNSYWTVNSSLARLGTQDPGSELVRLRPDWVEIVGRKRTMNRGRNSRTPLVNRGEGFVGWEKVGYVYTEGGPGASEPVVFTVDEVAHYAPIPDPMAVFTGMSWITPILREIQADKEMTRHQRKFFEQGAPQPLDAKILTPDGWSTMGDMRVGSRVIGSDGKPHEVVAVYPQGVKDIYRVTFSGGATVECTRDHLWSVASIADRRKGITRTMTLGEIIDGGVRYASGPAKWSVPLVTPVEFDPQGDLPVHPYLLGSLLGDGSFRIGNGEGSATITLATHIDDADEQQEAIGVLLPDGVQIKRRDRGGWSEFRFVREAGIYRNPLAAAIRDLGLLNKLGYEKLIPRRYMLASVNERVALLQGLLDTDGHVDKRQPNTITFTSTSRDLAAQVAELANGLGGIGTVRKSREATGTTRAQWVARITRLPEWITPFRLQRKVDVYRPTRRGGAYRYIQSVELVDRREAQCIAVDCDDHLYVTDGYVLTHNTPNMVIKHFPGAPGVQGPSIDAIKRFAQELDKASAGTENAYKTLHLYPGAEATVVGANLRDIDFKEVRGGGETRIAAAAGVPPVIVGLSEGLEAATYSNYSQARRRFADGTMHPLWQNAAGTLEDVLTIPDDASRLWYDATHVPFLREDEKDAAEIARVRAETINSYITAGYEPDSVVAAVEADDPRLLVHSGLYSVQLQQPGAENGPAFASAAASPARGRCADCNRLILHTDGYRETRNGLRCSRCEPDECGDFPHLAIDPKEGK